MKTRIIQRKSERANVLIVALCVMGFAGLALMTFLTLTEGQNSSVSRSQNWNASIPLVEAGIEEALTHLNDDCTFTDISHPPSTAQLDSSSWTDTDMGVSKTTTLPGGGYYTVEILTAPPFDSFNPGVVAEGFIPSLTGCTLVSPVPFLAQIGTQTTTTQNTNVARKVSVRCGASALFAKGLVAKDTIDMHGNPVASDSFDSGDPAFSTGGLYDPTKRKANGDIATTSGLINSVNIGQANIYGHVSTGPGGSVAIGANGAVGDLNWQNSGKTGIEPGYFADDMNVYFPDVKAPFNGGWSSPVQDTNVAAYTLSTASATNTTSTWPEGENPIITNTVTVTTSDYPSAGTYLGTPTMNTAYTTTTSLPIDGTYVGVIVTNTANTTATGYPGSGTYVGTPQTNTVSTTTPSYPAAGSYVGLVQTNTVGTVSSSYPAAGTYVGGVTTNCSTTLATAKTAPAAGTYCPSTPPWQTGNSTANSSAWNWYPVTGYTYNKITGYTYNLINSYSFQAVSSYSYSLITGWTWAKIVSYTYYTYSSTPTLTTNHYDFVLDSGNYEVSKLYGSVLVTGNAVLYVTDDINTQSIIINSGASLKLYTSAPSVAITGNGVWNPGGNATNFMYYGMPENKDIKIAGNGSFTGVIYAPEASLDLKGSGNNTVTDFTGASVTGSAVLDGHFNFHYDEALRKTGPASAYAIQTWNEIPLTQRY